MIFNTTSPCLHLRKCIQNITENLYSGVRVLYGLNGEMVGKIITLVYNCVSNSEHIHLGMHISFTMENDDDNIEHNDFF